jgi:5-methylcytosine-specific restriction endonuclease McrA
MVRKKINWEKYDHLLGCMPDAEMASEIGCSDSAVRERRTRLGILPNFQLIDLSSCESWLGVISDRALAEKAGCSPKTISKYRNKLGISPFRPPRQKSTILDNGKRVCYKCTHELSSDVFLISNKTQSYSNTCRSCRNADSRNQRLNRKREAVMLLGGKCSYCGFDEFVSSLQFHHVFEDKETEISRLFFLPGKREELLLELDKCCLLCSNHHDAFHAAELDLCFEKSELGYRVTNMR